MPFGVRFEHRPNVTYSPETVVAQSGLDYVAQQRPHCAVAISTKEREKTRRFRGHATGQILDLDILQEEPASGSKLHLEDIDVDANRRHSSRCAAKLVRGGE